MPIFAISDLHMPGPDGKTMDCFGRHWDDHLGKIAADWRMRVNVEDIVLLPGDLSWAMTQEQALPDIAWLNALPGRKIILRGNHDYWWDSISKERAAIAPALALQNDSILIDNLLLCGSRGWICPGQRGFTKQDETIYLREGQRLRLSLGDAVRRHPEHTPRVMLHFPPFNSPGEPTLFTEALEEYGVRQVIYGHLHGPYRIPPYEGYLRGIHYQCVACDFLGFTLMEWPDEPEWGA